jgi:hypothetical protein
MGNWTQQRDLSACEAEVTRLLRESTDGVPQAVLVEADELLLEDAELSTKLADAQAGRNKWASVAKKLDANLQQELDQQKSHDIMALFARHPAGEVSIPRGYLENDNEESEDEDYDRGPAHRTAYDRARGGGDVSSDEEDDRSTQASSAPAGNSAGGVQARRQLFDALADAGLSDSSGSAHSPTSESGSLRASPMASPATDPASRRAVAKEIPATSPPSSRGLAGRHDGSQSPSVGESTEDDDLPKQGMGSNQAASGRSPAVAPSLVALSANREPTTLVAPPANREPTTLASAKPCREESDDDSAYDDDFVEEEIAETSLSSQNADRWV